MSTISVHDLHKSYGSTKVLRGLSLQVTGGTFVAVLGASGCGKTTLLRVLAGFEGADHGEVQLAGAIVDDSRRRAPPEQRRVGYVPQEGALFPHLDVAANIAFGLPRKKRNSARTGELIELVGLQGLAHRRPHELSGGQQQRVALARALAVDPEIVLLDEPFAALDPELRASTRTDVKSALAQVGTTTVLVTHDQEEALSLADEVAILRDGAIVQAGAPQHVYREPNDAQTARFLGDANLLAARRDCSCAETQLGLLSLANAAPDGPSQDCTVLIRPEDLRLTPATEECDCLTAHVAAVEYYGHDARVTLILEHAAPSIKLVARTTGADAPRAGSRVQIVLPDRVHALRDEPTSEPATVPTRRA